MQNGRDRTDKGVAPSGERPRGASRRRRWLLPREHGAYPQLLLPMVTGLALGHFAWPAVCLSLAALGLFLGHEPLLVVLGHRGGRLQRREGERARRFLVLLGAAAALLTASALLGISSGVWAALLAPLLPALAVMRLLARRRERTTAGEVLVSLALAGSCLPIGLAAGAPVEAAVVAWLVWCGNFGVLTVAVRGILAATRKRGPDRRLLWGALTAAIAIQGLLLALSLGGRFPGEVALAFAPPTLLTITLALRPPSPRNLRTVGLGLVVAGLATMAGLLGGLT